MPEKSETASPRPLSLFRLVVDQARLTPEVLDFPYPGSGTQEDPHIVSFIPDDVGDPYHWPAGRRWMITVIAGLGTLATSFASTVFSGTLRELEADLHASTELITATISLFVLGFVIGPLLWAPLSELYGRQKIFFISYGIFTAFAAGCCGANNVATLLVLRFFAGSFSSSTLTNTAGVIADTFPASSRGLALGFYILMPSMGPTMGPFCGGFLGENQGWKWVAGLVAIFAGVIWILGTALIPETYASVILHQRAAKLSQMTGKVYALKSDIEKGKPSLKQILRINLTRPALLLIREPIVLLLALYMAIIYGTLYLLFGAYPIIFQVERGWSEGIGGLPFLGGAVGMLGALAASVWMNKHYNKVVQRNNGVVAAEIRLIPSMYASIAIPIGLFWFAWTNDPSIHWVSPVLSGIPFGFGLLVLFSSVTTYLIDSYVIFAASAVAATTVLRCAFGAAFPLFTPDMYHNLGPHWASSVPAFLSLACVPVPFIFYRYGARIRKHCVYAAQAEAIMKQLRAPATAAVEPQEPADSAESGEVQSAGEESGEAVEKL